jgi:hypothetical protein
VTLPDISGNGLFLLAQCILTQSLFTVRNVAVPIRALAAGTILKG